MRRRSVRTNIGRCRAGREIEKANTASDEALIADLAYPQRTVDPFGDQVEMPLVARKRQLDIRVLSKEPRQSPHDLRAGDECRCIHPNASSRSRRTMRE